MTRVLSVPEEYNTLWRVYIAAYEQASEGKGRERHAEAGEPYENQIICEVARRVGLGYPLGQAVKKIYESQRLGGDAGLQELLGALNYVAAAFIVMQERVKDETATAQEEFDKALDEAQKKFLPGLAKKAEGCEELVEKDAPQTKEELIERIKSASPAIYGAHVE